MSKFNRSFFTLVFFTFVLTLIGCNADQFDGGRLLDAIVWAGEHPALVGVIVTLLTPLIAMIPVVGAPVAAIWAKVGVSVIPALKEVAEAVERDNAARTTTRSRTVSESAAVVIGKLADDPKNPVGRIPGAKAIAEAGARGLIARIRARRAARNS